MTSRSRFSFSENTVGGGNVQLSGNTDCSLEILPGKKGIYRLAQIDDYQGLARSSFPWAAPMRINLSARASSRAIPGTWGFGLWNDPFGLAFVQGSKARLPVLPNAAWFFFASELNYLSIRDDLPASGQLAATFRAPQKRPIKLLLGLPLFSLVFAPPIARYLRRWLRDYIKQDSATLNHDPTEWHDYEIDWQLDRVIFKVNKNEVLKTKIIPSRPLGLVIWVDNQYARWLPDGRFGYGTQANSEAFQLQIKDLDLTPA